MVNIKNHYDRFIRFISDTSIDDLLAATEGHQKSVDSINAVNEWAMKTAGSEAAFKELEDIFSGCLLADETLWFNLGWRIGWTEGACQKLKKKLKQDTKPSTHDQAGVIDSSLDVT